ncbi:hypothetical protein S40285_03437 [Stachybotrys chlorohalonatus IBT 40285]|uniref:Uncharacterized protein n=1 Tax=Stachybotrys chlorohalonatus (strain IBT 40285) TaxID=1283841 RepID=A0A084QBW5_STAC4|nr:hypothetical protein S40285_03437 [Stachybotrys chlorohalonata IBT 40285]
MKIPYNRLCVGGDVLFAARGGKIHTFNLQDGSHISTWHHPDVELVANAIKELEEAGKQDAPAADLVIVPTPDSDEPPAKRQRLTDDEAASAAEGTAPVPPSDVQESGAQPDAGGTKGQGEKKNKKNKKTKQGGEKKTTVSRVPDRPVITHLVGTSDGKHLVVITGHDKTIWVFDHDGKGNISQFSKRTMPKRPSAVALGPDSQIICADKFGDVYALPLLGTTFSKPPSAAPLAPAKSRSKPEANAFTVHSQRNLRALAAQERKLELAGRSKGAPPAAKTEEPQFEITLLLGHVSMLTALALGESEGRRYIVTGDRDEHIRVSRYIPQAHVIEGFCLGHKEFVGDVVIPPGRPEVLVSGGGDEDLFAWDWKSGRLLSRTSVLSLAQELSAETSKVSVSALSSFLYPTEAGKAIYILAIAEGINAIFSWQLADDNSFKNPSIIQLPGMPLHLTPAHAENTPPRIIGAIDPGEEGQAKSLHVFSLVDSNGRLSVDQDVTVHDSAVEADELDVSAADVRRLLYNTESLRKYSGETGEGAEGAEGEEGQEAEEDPGAVDES